MESFPGNERRRSDICFFERRLLIFDLLLQSFDGVGEGPNLLPENFNVACHTGRRGLRR